MYHFEAVVNVVISILDLTGFQVVKSSFLVQRLSKLIDHFSAVLLCASFVSDVARSDIPAESYFAIDLIFAILRDHMLRRVKVAVVKPIFISLIMSYSSLGTRLWHMLTRDHTQSHTFIHKWNEPHMPLTPSRRASPHFGWYSFPIQLRVGF